MENYRFKSSTDFNSNKKRDNFWTWTAHWLSKALNLFIHFKLFNATFLSCLGYPKAADIKTLKQAQNMCARTHTINDINGKVLQMVDKIWSTSLHFKLPLKSLSLFILCFTFMQHSKYTKKKEKNLTNKPRVSEETVSIVFLQTATNRPWLRLAVCEKISKARSATW